MSGSPNLRLILRAAKSCRDMGELLSSKGLEAPSIVPVPVGAGPGFRIFEGAIGSRGLPFAGHCGGIRF